MSNDLALPSQDDSQRQIQQLNMQPFTGAPEEQDRALQDEATLKVPVSTPEQANRSEEWLVATTTLPTQEQIQTDLSPIGRELHNKPEFISQFPPKRPRLKKTALPFEAEREQSERPSSIAVVEAEQQEQFQQHPTSATQDVVLLDTLQHSTPDDLETSRMAAVDDDPEFEKLRTIPMMVLTNIATKQGTEQLEMKSEVSGAAGAAGIVGLGNIIGSILKYVSTFLIQYGFGAGGYGLYTLCLSLINLAAAVFNLGLDDAIVRYVAIYRGKRQTKSLQGLLLFCTALAGIAGMLGAVLLLLFTTQLVTLWISLKHHTHDNDVSLARTVSLLQVMAPMIPLMTMQVMWFAGLRGFRAFKWRVLSTGILQPLLQILLLVVVLILFRSKDGITAVALVLLISTIFSTILNLYFLFRQVSLVATPEPEQYEVREWLTFATLNFLTTIIDTVLDSIDTILLAAFGIIAVAIGQYGAALRLSNFIAMPLISLNNIFAPTIAELHSKGEMKKLESMFKIMTKWSISFSLPIFLIMVLFSPYLLAIPGADFAPAWPLLIAFSLGALINAGTGAVGYMLLMTGYQRLSFLNSLVAVTVNIVLGILLTPRYGAMGTAISTGLAICALNFMRMLQVGLLLKMHPYRMDSLKPVVAGLISAIIIGIALYLIYLLHIRMSLMIGHAIFSIQLLLIPVFLELYIWLLIVFKGSPEDEIVLKAIRNKFMQGKGKNNVKKVKEA